MSVLDMTTCPECCRPAEVQWRTVVESTSGPVELARVVCVERHWFLLPVADLDRAPRLEASPTGTVAETAAEDAPGEPA